MHIQINTDSNIEKHDELAIHVKGVDEQSRRLAGLFRENSRQFEGEVVPAIASAGPGPDRGGPR